MDYTVIWEDIDGVCVAESPEIRGNVECGLVNGKVVRVLGAVYSKGAVVGNRVICKGVIYGFVHANTIFLQELHGVVFAKSLAIKVPTDPVSAINVGTKIYGRDVFLNYEKLLDIQVNETREELDNFFITHVEPGKWQIENQGVRLIVTVFGRNGEQWLRVDHEEKCEKCIARFVD